MALDEGTIGMKGSIIKQMARPSCGPVNREGTNKSDVNSDIHHVIQTLINIIDIHAVTSFDVVQSKKIKSKDITEINVALPQTTTILFLPLFDNDQVQAAICTCLVCTLKLILHTHISQDVATAGPCSSRW